MGSRAKRLTQKLFLGSFVMCIMGFYCFMAPENQATHSVALAACADAGVRNDSRSQTCSPKVHLMFMKTHKTASSTLMNILLRFGQKHQLKFALPERRNDFFYPSSFARTQVKNYRAGLCYDVLCNHMRFNAPEVEKLLPADAFFFTILRDPAELFESSFHYYKGNVPQTWRIPGEDQLEEFLAHPGRYFSPRGINAFYLKNLQFFDFGFENDLEADDPRIPNAIEYIERHFQLVLISDHFEESLILLKEALCWQMDDLLFFKLNARKASSVSPMSAELKIRARQWNAADWQLYRHFNGTFWARVEAYGRDRMREQVTQLRRRNAEMEAICIADGGPVEARHITDGRMKPWQPFGQASILGYNLRSDVEHRHRELCRRMLTPEIQYLSDLGVNLWITQLWGWVKDSVVQLGMS